MKNVANKITFERVCLFILLIGFVWYFYYPFTAKSQQIQFYYRAGGSNNSWDVINDYFKITNYSNGSVTTKKLYLFAQHYVDTVHASLPVCSVRFVGQTKNGSLPYDIADDIFNKVSKQSLIKFVFSNSFPQAPKAEKKLISITVFIGNQQYSYDNRFNKKERQKIDEIITSNEPFDNGFDSVPITVTILFLSAIVILVLRRL